MNDLRQHLIDRGMNPDAYNVSFDNDEQTITFLLFNPSGTIVGYQLYRPGNNQKKKRNDEKFGRYYTYTTKYKTSDGTLVTDGVFGLEALEVSPTQKTTRPLFIVEGVFKAGVLQRLGFDAIAVLTSTPKRLNPWFRIIRSVRPLIAIGDPDKAGQQLVNLVRAGFTSPLDLDEMEDVDIIKLIEENT